MRLASPEWLLLGLGLLIGARLFPTLALARPARILAAGLLVLALAGLERSSRSAGLDLWVLLDRSDSVAPEVEARVEEWQAILREGRGRADRLFWVDFAEAPRIVADGEAARFEGRTDETRLGLALRAVAAGMDPARAHRVLVLSDGYPTDSLEDVAAAYVGAQAPVDLRLVTPPEGGDAWVERFDAPERVAEGAPVLLEIEVRSTEAGAVPIRVLRDGAELYRGQVQVTARGGRLRLVDRPTRPGGHRYTARLLTEGDAAPGNDVERRWVEVEGAPSLLLVTRYPDGPLRAALARAGFGLRVFDDPGALHVGLLSGARALVIEDVPAHRIPRDFLRAVPFWVKAQGGGLAMVGGPNAFGAGGYFESPIDPVLPVSMELRQEHRKLAVALAVVLDRSGSMSARVASPRGPVTKMELANDASARAVELLSDQDQITVLAVDSEPHIIVPRVALSAARGEVLDALRRIDSRGGGIFVFEGLSAAWAQLEPAAVGQRHVILFSDAADSEQPGDYRALLEQMQAAKATVSVIGLGTRKDADADLLVDIAERGGGRIFFTDSAAELPALFAQETVAVARSVFVKEPAGVAETAGWLEIAPRALDWPAVVDGYNLSYAREGATVAARTRDEEAAPLVAFWRAGRGRSVAVTFPMGGEYSASVRGWSGYGDFAGTLARWLAGEGVPPGVALASRREGSTLWLDLLHDESWDEAVGRSPPRIAVARGDVAEEGVWARVGPGRWRARLELPRQGYLRGAVQVGRANLSFGPTHAAESLEWRRDDAAKAAVLALSAATGGARRTRLSDVWRAPRPARYESLTPWLLAFALALLLFDAFVERAGLRRPQLAWPERAPRAAAAPTPVTPEAPAEPAPPPEPENPEVDAAARRRARLDRAKRRR